MHLRWTGGREHKIGVWNWSIKIGVHTYTINQFWNGKYIDMLWGIDSCSHHPEPVAYALKTRLISLVHFSFKAEEAAMLSCAKLKYFGLTGVRLHGTLSPIFTCQVSIGVTVWSAFTSLWPSMFERGRSWWENGFCTTTCWFQHGSSDELFFGTWGLPYDIAVWCPWHLVVLSIE